MYSLTTNSKPSFG